MCKKKNITLKLMGALLAAQKYHVSYKGMATFKTPSNILLIIINQPDRVMFINKERSYEVSNTRFDKDYIVDNVRMWLEEEEEEEEEHPNILSKSKRKRRKGMRRRPSATMLYNAALDNIIERKRIIDEITTNARKKKENEQYYLDSVYENDNQ
jgi:hypothetical protein